MIPLLLTNSTRRCLEKMKKRLIMMASGRMRDLTMKMIRDSKVKQAFEIEDQFDNACL